MSAPKVFGPNDPEPQVRPGAVAAVRWGNYREQELWVLSGANIGNWYPLGGEFGRPRWAEDPRPYSEQMTHPGEWQRPSGTVPLHPRWEDIVARGPVVLLTPGDDVAYAAGWATGRRLLLEQIEELSEEGPDRA